MRPWDNRTPAKFRLWDNLTPAKFVQSLPLITRILEKASLVGGGGGGKAWECLEAGGRRGRGTEA